VQVELANALAETEVERRAPRQARFIREGILKCGNLDKENRGKVRGDYFNCRDVLYHVATRELETPAGLDFEDSQGCSGVTVTILRLCSGQPGPLRGYSERIYEQVNFLSVYMPNKGYSFGATLCVLGELPAS